MPGPDRDPLVLAARSAADRGAWTEALTAYREADAIGSLRVGDLERAGVAAHLTGHDGEAVELLSRAHRAAADAGDPARAARGAFWLGMMLGQSGDVARAGGWMGRAAGLIEEHGLDTVERGYLLVPQGLQRLDARAVDEAYAMFAEAGRIAERFGDADLATMSRLGRGRALVDRQEITRGVGLLDEAMLAVTSGEVSPIVVGIVYCASIEIFQSVYDLRRAQAWTEALRAWCEAQPDLVPFRGRCLLYRAEILQLHGEWSEAITEARRAQELLSRPPPEPAVGEAYYQRAELHRLRGEEAAAETAYRAASRWGRAPDAGLALLRLAQGRRAAARATIRRALGEAPDDVARARLLEPWVEIALAEGDVPAARAAASDLRRLAALTDAPALTAMADRVDGLVHLAEGDVVGGLRSLRRSAVAWQGLDAPYELARVRAAIGEALRRLGDAESAALEFDAARAAFSALGARPDLDRLASVLHGRSDGLSPREVEVLEHVAAGQTNREIAAELGISERTVDRHVSNLFDKLGVSTRAAATAYAYEHGLMG
jgi:DNA-binding CsgD family transcriptional regulator